MFNLSLTHFVLRSIFLKRRLKNKLQVLLDFVATKGNGNNHRKSASPLCIHYVSPPPLPQSFKHFNRHEFSKALRSKQHQRLILLGFYLNGQTLWPKAVSIFEWHCLFFIHRLESLNHVN